ncbi:pitrilysin family protein [Mesorhizobium sp. 8]|uniref:M16 family metallopeptidase n=1 Tax=Mesorhizobium sp. 8 TaxID=2584466 RepID=UPI00111E38F8|nr:pitrilysin family protein [Mesorhizobium sp. 8]QDB99410.1 insulinase family protein [Mesorhizobium sp. 8]
MTMLAARLRSWFVVLVLAAGSVVPAAAEQKAGQADITDFTLANGMQVVVIPDRRAPIVTHMVWYKVGSADEPPGKSGIAHFFEHLMFKATKTYPEGAFDKAIAAIGGSNNAFTSYDYTAFYETVPPAALGEMMAFEADRMRNLILDDKTIVTERDVILEERRARVDNDPSSLLEEEVDATLWQNQPYRIPVIGWKQEIEKLDRADALTFYDHYYRPNNAILVVAGDVDAETVRALAQKSYGKLERGPDLPPRIRPVEPEQNSRRTVTLTDARVGEPSFSTQWVVPSYHTGKPGEAEALDLLSEILGGGPRSRLYQELVVRKKIATSAGASFQGNMLDDTNFAVYAEPRDGNSVADVEAAANAEAARIATGGVTEEELDRAKDRFIRSTVFARDRQDAMANMYGATLATGGTIEDITGWPDRIRKVTAEQVKTAAARYLVPDRSVTGYLLPKTQVAN